MIISVDFDSTCTIDGYPNLGYNIGAQYALKRLVSLNHCLVLHTCRMNSKISYDGSVLSVNPLKQSLSWFAMNNIPIDVVESRSKPYADLYIDDRGLNIPLIHCRIKNTPTHFVDWVAISRELYNMNIFSFSDYLQVVPNITSDLLTLLPIAEFDKFNY